MDDYTVPFEMKNLGECLNSLGLIRTELEAFLHYKRELAGKKTGSFHKDGRL